MQLRKTTVTLCSGLIVIGLSACGNVSTKALPTAPSGTVASTNNSSTSPYVSSYSPAAGTYSNIPTSVTVYFSTAMSSNVLQPSYWTFKCGSTSYGVNSVSGSGSVYQVSLPSVSVSSGNYCYLSASSSIQDVNGYYLQSGMVTYVYSPSAGNSGSGGTSLPTINADFNIQGALNSYTLSNISTDTILKVTVSLGQPTTIPGTGYTANFTCAKFTITAAGASTTVFLSNTGSAGYGNCAGAVTSQTVDFSGRLSTGHGLMSVKVSNAMYDNCRLYGNVYAVGCPLTSVYGTHITTGSLAVSVNGSN